MLDNRFLAGAIAGIPISLLCLAYVAVRRDAVVALFTEGGGSEVLSPGVATGLAFGTAALIGPGLGLAAALVHGWLPSEGAYVAVALGLATLLSVVAVASRTPLMVEKVVLNYAVAIALGVVAPRLIVG
jgi:hypothetical protein